MIINSSGEDSIFPCLLEKVVSSMQKKLAYSHLENKS